MPLKNPNIILKALESNAIDCSDETSGHGIEELLAKAIAYPLTIRELSLVMSIANQERWVVAPWGGGTLKTLGNPLQNLDLIIDLSRMNAVIEHNPADLTVTVEAGITIAKLQKFLSIHRQFLALDPPIKNQATIGGTLATAINGPSKWRHGNPRDVVIGMKVVQADGKVTKSGGQVVKNVSGYDLARLHIGGFGTLGIIAEASFKLTPSPEHETTLMATFKNMDTAIQTALYIFRSKVIPLALTVLHSSDNTRISHLFPSENNLLIIRLGGRPLTLNRALKESESICNKNGATKTEILKGTSTISIWNNLADYGWNKNTRPLVGSRAQIQPSAVADLTKSISLLKINDSVRVEIISNPAHGTVLINWYSNVNHPSDEIILDIINKTRDLTHKLGGYITIEQCPVRIKSIIDVWDNVSGTVTIMRKIKDQYDPNRVLNPGRYVGGI